MLNLFLDKEKWMCHPADGRTLLFREYAEELVKKDQTVQYAVLGNSLDLNVFVVINIDQAINEKDHFIAFTVRIVTTNNGRHHNLVLSGIRDSILAGQFVGRLTNRYYDRLAITVNTEDESNDLFGFQLFETNRR
jgi:hypothetical protein